MDTLDNLRAFVATAESGSFSKAARQQGLVPSVVAKRIDQLEWRVRAPLFTRSTRRLRLTDVGERYLPEVRRLIREMDETLAGMARSGGGIEGHIRIKIPTTLGVLRLSALLQDFMASEPMISLDVVLADRSVNPVEEGFDMAIGARPESYGKVQDHPLCPIQRRLCAAPAYLLRRGVPQTPAQLLDHDCLVFATSGLPWEFQGPQGLVGVEVRPRLKTNDGLGLCQATLAGQGIAVLADYLGAPHLRSGALVEVLPQMRLPDLWLKALVPSSRIELPRIQALLRWLSRHLASEPLSPPANDQQHAVQAGGAS